MSASHLCQQVKSHDGMDAAAKCFCFLRLGQMFLPPNVWFDGSVKDRDHDETFSKRKIVGTVMKSRALEESDFSLGSSQGNGEYQKDGTDIAHMRGSKTEDHLREVTVDI